uniref:Uncharacterized protein n=1 Tax=Romanomermis culicivorax TaxID=13658 RepID=A0A915J2T2_ROMCU
MPTKTPDKIRPMKSTSQQQPSGGASATSPTSTTPETTSMPQQPPGSQGHASTTNPPVETFNIQRDEDKNRTAPLKNTKDYFKWQKVTKQSAIADDVALLNEGRERQTFKKKCSIM